MHRSLSACSPQLLCVLTGTECLSPIEEFRTATHFSHDHSSLQAKCAVSVSPECCALTARSPHIRVSVLHHLGAVAAVDRTQGFLPRMVSDQLLPHDILGQPPLGPMQTSFKKCFGGTPGGWPDTHSELSVQPVRRSNTGHLDGTFWNNPPKGPDLP